MSFTFTYPSCCCVYWLSFQVVVMVIGFQAYWHLPMVLGLSSMVAMVIAWLGHTFQAVTMVTDSFPLFGGFQSMDSYHGNLASFPKQLPWLSTLLPWLLQLPMVFGFPIYGYHYRTIVIGPLPKQLQWLSTLFPWLLTSVYILASSVSFVTSSVPFFSIIPLLIVFYVFSFYVFYVYHCLYWKIYFCEINAYYVKVLTL